MTSKKEIAEQYKHMKQLTDFPWCWWCGRDESHRPEGWYPKFLIERAHIVNKPRVEDRRAVILLCSLCHKVSHGEQLVLPGMKRLVAPNLGNMLWLKNRFDEAFYDRAFLNAHSIIRMPVVRQPINEVLDTYYDRRSTPQRKRWPPDGTTKQA